MSKLKIFNGATRVLNKVGIKVKKHSPEILVAAGVVGVVTSAVMACKATTKAGAIKEEMKAEMDKIHEVANMPEVENYTEEDLKKDTAIVYAQTGVKYVKLYAPSIILGALSITSIIAGHRILTKRNIALAAAYATVDKSFKDYRSRVIEQFGKELDKELKHNIKAKEFEEIVVDGKGKEKTVKKTVSVVDPNEYSEYARFYDDGCNGWTKDAEMNLVFLKKQQNYANDKLQKVGYLFLNEVYDMLGIPRTKAGQIVGWVYDESNPDSDNFVDFGMCDTNKETVRNFVNGYERVILLDFNVQGCILDLI